MSKVEVLKCIGNIKRPTKLLKFGKSGKPKMLAFYLSDDCKILHWDSHSKSKDQSQIVMDDVSKIIFGQRTEKFKRNARPDLAQHSFSLLYKRGKDTEDTLDVSCKDEQQFQTWTSALIAIHEKKIDMAAAVSAKPETDVRMVGSEQSEPEKDSKGVHKKKLFPPTHGTVVATVGTDKLQSANDVYSFGDGDWGQDGHAQLKPNKTPQLVKSLLLLGKGIMAVACGWSHTSVVLEDGKMMQFGNRIGTGLLQDSLIPMHIQLPITVTVHKIACGNNHSLLLSSTGEVYSWGCNFHGQLGHGNVVDMTKPTRVEAFVGKQIADIECGHNSSAAITAAGTLFTWGCGAHGQLATNKTEDVPLPTVVDDLKNTHVVRVACGEAHMLAVTEDKDTFAWGWNGCGQLGLGHTEDQLRPVVVEAFRGALIADVRCGAAHTLALVFVSEDSSQVYGWGCNMSGQLGMEKRQNFSKPTPVHDVSTTNVVIALACGAHHSALLTQNGEVLTAGANHCGQLGQVQAGHDCHTFKLVEGLKSKQVRSISAGGEFTCTLVAREWVGDDEAVACMKCGGKFTFSNRRHHCRHCGGIFCANCTSKRCAILKFNIVEPVRVCDKCFETLTQSKGQ